jgi:hypothetical protein
MNFDCMLDQGPYHVKSLLFHELKQEETTSFVWKNFLKQEVPP